MKKLIRKNFDPEKFSAIIENEKIKKIIDQILDEILATENSKNNLRETKKIFKSASDFFFDNFGGRGFWNL